MANVDYVVVHGPSLAEVVDAVRAAVSGTQVIAGNRVHVSDDRAEITMWARSWEPDATVVEVYHAGDLDDRRALTRRAYDHLVDATEWDLEMTSDDADGVIASRTMSRRT